jgi:hypothetical protein
VMRVNRCHLRVPGEELVALVFGENVRGLGQVPLNLYESFRNSFRTATLRAIDQEGRAAV